jgi:hypothetical protein
MDNHQWKEKESKSQARKALSGPLPIFQLLQTPGSFLARNSMFCTIFSSSPSHEKWVAK